MTGVKYRYIIHVEQKLVSQKQKQKLSEILDFIQSRHGNIKEVFEKCKADAQEAMSLEVILLILLRHVSGRDRMEILFTFPSLIIPFMLRLIRSKIGL